MCGITGIFRPNGLNPPDVETVKKMNALQVHRGPDDEGIYQDDHCVLGHRRLSIIDLSTDGRQPFHSDDHRFQIVYNGELYNYIELRKELEAVGWRFRTKTDTEVLLKAYQHFGQACLSRLNGMFAFAVYDSARQSLFLARDRFGIKPLYYYLNGSALYWASEIKAFKTLPSMRLSMNEQSLFDYLVFNRTDVHSETFFSEIKRLPKGCYATFDGKRLRVSQWWNPEDYLVAEGTDDLRKASLAVEEILVSAVRLRMRSDVPVGSCLSGGLDSSVLIGILFTHHGVGEGYPTFTASFPGHPIDETHYVDGLKRIYPFRNIRTYPSVVEARDKLENFVYANDEPTTNASFFSQYEVMRLARENGVTVLMDGQGGDEGFAGYQYFHGFQMYGHLRSGRALSFGTQIVKSIIRKQHKSAYQTLLFQMLPHAVKKKMLLKSVPFIHKDFFYEYVDKSLIYREFFNATNLNQSLVRHYQYKLEHLLRMEDRNSMAFSLEARVPYLDYRLVEYLLGISGDLKIRNGETKYLQKQALGRYTTPQILHRLDKIGFGTPGEEWMLNDIWRNVTLDNYRQLATCLPKIFLSNGRLPRRGFDRWKINQLATWKNLFID